MHIIVKAHNLITLEYHINMILFDPPELLKGLVSDAVATLFLSLCLCRLTTRHQDSCVTTTTPRYSTHLLPQEISHN